MKLHPRRIARTLLHNRRPENLQDSATAEALQAICDLDLTELQAIVPAARLRPRLTRATSRVRSRSRRGANAPDRRGRGLRRDRTQRAGFGEALWTKGARDRSGASRLFPEPGALEMVVDRAQRWFERYLGMNARAATPT
jgi:hypothetical protein